MQVNNNKKMNCSLQRHGLQLYKNTRCLHNTTSATDRREQPYHYRPVSIFKIYTWR